MSKRPEATADWSALSDLAPELAEMLVSVASDIALVLDSGGVVRSVSFGNGDPADVADPVRVAAEDWVGRRWVDTVTRDTRQKVEELLRDVVDTGVSRLRHVNHASPAGRDIPMAYTAIRLGELGPVLVVGRDLRAVTAIQQRFVSTQQEMERDYWKMRRAETRYRLLFQIATGPVLVVDALSLRVVEANRSAARLLGLSVEEVTGSAVTLGLDQNSHASLDEMLANTRATGRSGEVDAWGAAGRGKLRIRATRLQMEGANLLLVRLQGDHKLKTKAGAEALAASFIEKIPDAIVFTNKQGRILYANPAFLMLSQLEDETSARGLAIENFICASPGEFSSLLDLIKQNGSASSVATCMRGAQGRMLEIDLSASLVCVVDDECIGFIVRATPGAAADRRPDMRRSKHPVH